MSLYVEAEKAARELGIRQRGGFFSSDDDYCQALLDGAFNKALVVRRKALDGVLHGVLHVPGTPRTALCQVALCAC